MKIYRKDSMFRRNCARRHIIGYIYKLFCILFQFCRIERRMYTCHIIRIIIWIMHIYNVRSFLLQVIFLIGCNRNIWREQFSFIMRNPFFLFLIKAVIRNWHYKCFAADIILCRQINAFQGIPHGSFIWHKNNLIHFL